MVKKSKGPFFCIMNTFTFDTLHFANNTYLLFLKPELKCTNFAFNRTFLHCCVGTFTSLKDLNNSSTTDYRFLLFVSFARTFFHLANGKWTALI